MQFIGVFGYMAISTLIEQLFRYYPMRRHMRLGPAPFIALQVALTLAQCAILYALGPGYWGSLYHVQVYRGIAVLFNMALSFLLVRGHFFKMLFLATFMLCFGQVMVGFAMSLDILYGGEISDTFPFLIIDLFMLAVGAVTMPITLHLLERVIHLEGDDKSFFWRVLWVIPLIFFMLALTNGSIYFGSVTTPAFILSRVLILAGMAVVLYTAVHLVQQTARNATLRENVRMTRMNLNTQKEQFEKITEEVKAARVYRHDMRHQYAALQSYVENGDREGAKQYLDQLSRRLGSGTVQYCANHSVNAMAQYYLGIAAERGVQVQHKLHVPTQAGDIQDIDLSIVFGNLFENALEACTREAAPAERFIRVRAQSNGEYLMVAMDNSFDGVVLRENETFHSRKHRGEGIGLGSIRAITEKYNGFAEFSCEGMVFYSSVMLALH